MLRQIRSYRSKSAILTQSSLCTRDSRSILLCSQIDKGKEIFRIRAGSHESYNPSRVERVLTTMTRGAAKVIGTRNGLPEEFWKYKRKDVKNFIGIGWKIELDDEQGLDPLNLL